MTAVHLSVHEDHEDGENAEIGLVTIETTAQRTSSRLRRTNDRSALKCA